MDSARKLLDGKFHEDDDEDEIIIPKAVNPLAGKTLHAVNEDDLERKMEA